MKPLFLFITSVLFLPFSHGADSPKAKLDKAREEAAKEKKDLLIAFSGASWDQASQDFEEKILKTEEFQKGIGTDFVEVLINIPPTRQEASKDLLELEKTYRFRTIPTIILADAQARPYADAQPGKDGAAALLKKLKELHKIRVGRDEAFAAAKKAKGVKRAEYLVKALKTMPQESVADFYGKELEMISKADPENKTVYAGEIKKKEAIREEQTRFNELFTGRKYDEIIKESRKEAEKLKGEDAQRLKLYEVKALYAQKKYDEALKAVEDLKKLEPGSDLGKRATQFTAQIEGAKTRAEKMKEAAKKPKGPVVSKPVAIVTDINQLREDAKKVDEELAQAVALEKEATEETANLAQKLSKMEAEFKALQAKEKASVESLKAVTAKREKLARRAKAMKEVVENHEAMEKRKREIAELEKKAAELQKQADDLRKKAGEIRKGK